MTFGRTVLLGTTLWVTGITVLQHRLNPEESRGESVFQVGFLPVT